VDPDGIMEAVEFALYLATAFTEVLDDERAA
jgi:hypothetical protein